MKILGYLLFLAAGIVLLIFEVVWFYRWWGEIGVIIALFVPPLAALFPFIYLLKQGFSVFYFGVWAIGITGGVLASSTEKK